MLSASKLRADVYRILDQVLATGKPVEIERRGKRLRITAVATPDVLGALEQHPDAIVGDPDELVHLDWSAEWRP